MGNAFSLNSKDVIELENDIRRINKITENDLFFKKTLRTLNFELNLGLFRGLLSNKIIFCSLVSD